ncbi:MAG TPA: hypothetical protein VGN97_05315 [Mesorhizobium sp.]|jgi:hypothetical protein|nr:hypothetical protein [Mesorhizobium sp.]
MAEATPRTSLNVLQRALALIAAAALLFIQGAYTYSEGFSAPGWVFTAAISGLLLTVALWGAKLKRAPRAKNDGPEQTRSVLHKEEEDVEELDLDSAYEVEQRASVLTAALINRNSEAAAPATNGDQEASAPPHERQSRELVIREHCLWLMLGLVSLRRARGDGEHVKRPAYLRLQHAVLQRIFALRREASQQADGSTQEQLDEVKAAMRQVQAGIVSGCSARKEGAARPEQDLLAWFAEHTGVDLSQSPHVGRALSGKAWPATGEEV